MIKKIFFALFATALVVAGYGVASRDSGKLTLDNAYVSGRVLKISATADGVVDAYAVRRADQVVKGQRLFSISDNENDAKLLEYREALLAAIDEKIPSCADFLPAQTAPGQANAKAERSPVKKRPAVLQRARVQPAIAQLRGAFYRAAESEIKSPVDGYVYDVLVYPGRYVKKGENLLILIPREEPVIEANVLESEISLISPGTAVTVVPDVGGGKLRFSGAVQSIVPSVAATFSPLPRNNLDSNWIKTTQRIPILITLAPSSGKTGELPLGSSVKVIIDVAAAGSSRGERAAKAPAPVPVLSPERDLRSEFEDYLQAVLREHRDRHPEKLRRCN
jgi:multidrug resistance efflux pump